MTDPKEAETIRRIFKLFTYQSEEAGPLGVKTVRKDLTEKVHTF